MPDQSTPEIDRLRQDVSPVTTPDPFPKCVEHDNYKPCIRCALLCPCGCDALREGVTEAMWDAALLIEPYIKAKGDDHARA